jgi:hypothetical protein
VVGSRKLFRDVAVSRFDIQWLGAEFAVLKHQVISLKPERFNRIHRSSLVCRIEAKADSDR